MKERSRRKKRIAKYFLAIIERNKISKRRKKLTRCLLEIKAEKGGQISLACILTFRPLSGKRFRPNRPDKDEKLPLTKNPEQYRNKFRHTNLQGEQMSPIEQYPLKIPDRDNQIRCDECYQWLNVYNLTVVKCPCCNKKYSIKKK